MAGVQDAAFEAALRDLYYQWGSLGYWANRFYQKFSSQCKRYMGGVEAVRSVLHDETDGFLFLKKHDRLDLTVENLMLKPQWKGLFSRSELETAKKKLQ
jgi:hypothetical protein